MSRIRVNNVQELQAEIKRLKELKREQRDYLMDQYELFNHKIETPVRIFNHLKNSIPGVNLVQNLMSKNTNKDADWLTKTLRIGVPFLLNRFVLKDAGVVKKALALLVSDKAVGQINKHSLSDMIAKVTHFIRPKKSKKKPVNNEEVNPPAPDMDA